MNRMSGRLILGVLLLALAPAWLHAQETPQETPEERSTGLPSPVEWTFNFDAGWGTFGFANSLFNNPRDGVRENLSDQWFEGYVKPALSAAYTFASSAQVYGTLSVVGERTYGSVPGPFGDDVSSFGPEDLAIGWRSGDWLSLGANVLDFTVGRVPFELGNGLLLFDGAAEGGSRGGYWTQARKAFEFAAIGRFAPAHHKAEVFYLDRDDLPEYDTGSRLWGTNYEFNPADDTTLGVTYMKWFAHPDISPGRDGLHVINVRAYTAPLGPVPDLSFEFEYALERNAHARHSNAWTLRGAYELSQVAWTPTLSYRYAFFQGDDPATLVNEAFDPLLPGFSDWGNWWQGEIAGEYFLANSNLISHLVRAHVSPSERIGAGLMFYRFSADVPASYGPGVTDTDLAFETDAYVDWKVNEAFTVSVVLAFANPGRAVQQATGRTKNFAYGMVYVAYAY